MAGFADILGTLVQNGLSQSSGTRMTNAFGGVAGGDLGGLLGQVLGGAQGGSGQAMQGGDIGGMVSSVLNSLGNNPQALGAAGGSGGLLGSVLSNIGGNQAAIGGLGALAGALMGQKGAARGAVGGGAMALLASLAMSALKKSGQQPHQQPAAFYETPTDAQQQEMDSEAEVIVRAMISAAKADGHIDQQEAQRIIGKLDDGGLTAEEKEFFQREVQKPLNIAEIAASAGGRPELAAQIYAASLLAIEVDTVEEQQYLAALAQQLGLAPETVEYIEQTLAK